MGRLGTGREEEIMEDRVGEGERNVKVK